MNRKVNKLIAIVIALVVVLLASSGIQAQPEIYNDGVDLRASTGPYEDNQNYMSGGDGYMSY